MAQSLHISATFLTGNYHGAEWPPSPARLVQALVAASNTGGNRLNWPSVRQGLLWLENQQPPRIRARNVLRLSSYKTAVPNNDLDVIAKEWLAGRSANPSTIKTLKVISPRSIRESRFFPHVQYIWQLDGSEAAIAAAKHILPATSALYSLGWGVDMAFADAAILEEEPSTDWVEWVPSDNGMRFPVPVPGFVEDLESTYERFVARVSGIGVDTDTRPRVYRLQAYERKGDSEPVFATFELRTNDDEEVFQKPWRDTVEIAAWLRHAAGLALRDQFLQESLEGYVYGHSKDPSTKNNRLSYLPLPSIHPLHGDGRIRRAMVSEPLGASGRVTELLTAAWRGVSLQRDGVDVCILRPLYRDSVTSFYTSPAKCWNTVSPVILHGHNASNGIISPSKTEKLLLRAFEMAGYPESLIDSLAFQAAPLWRGTGTAKQIRVPSHLDNYPRYHVQVIFKDAIAGPVTAGIGRHFGIGLFAAKSGG